MNSFKISPELLIGGSSDIDAVFLPVNLEAEQSGHSEHWSGDLSDQHHYRHYHHNHNHLLSGHQQEQEKPLLQNGDVYIGISDRQSRDCMEDENEEEVGPSTVLMHAIITDTPDSNDCCYRATLTSIALIVIIVGLLVFGHSYIRSTLLWLEQTDPTISISVLTALFFVVCFPMAWGLSLLMVTSGYLFGFLYGPLVVTLGVTVGLALSTPIMQLLCSGYLRSRFYSRKVEAIINVVSGTHGMRIIALTRLTPIPFGLQNALFSLSSMPLPQYLISSTGGLIPMTLLNCYMGSTLRTMQDLMSDDSNRLTGFFIFGGQILITVILLWFVVRKARLELKKAMDESDKVPATLPSADPSKTVFVDHQGV